MQAGFYGAQGHAHERLDLIEFVTIRIVQQDDDAVVVAELGQRFVQPAELFQALVVEYGLVGFEPLARLAPNGESVFRISAQGSQAGDHTLRVQIRSKLSPTPVTKEEVTRVYVDR